MRFAVPTLFALSALSCGAPAQGSVGAILSHDSHTGSLIIHDAPPGLAADAAGLGVGDRVKMIDGVLVDDIDGRRIRALLRGPVGSKVTLTIVRGDEVLHVDIERKKMGNKAPVAERFEQIE